MTHGLGPSGFNRKTFQEILEAIQQEQRDGISQHLDFGDETVLGQLNKIVANKNAQLWELLQDVYKSLDPDQSEGEALVKLCSLVGVFPRSAKHSEVDLIVGGSGFSSIPTILAGSRVGEWETLTSVTPSAIGSGFPLFYGAFGTYNTFSGGVYANGTNGLVYQAIKTGSINRSDVLDWGTGSEISVGTAEFAYIRPIAEKYTYMAYLPNYLELEITYYEGDLVCSGDHVYMCIQEGTYTRLVDTPPSGTGDDIYGGPGGIRWRFVCPGTGIRKVRARHILPGPNGAGSFTINNIVTPIHNWFGANNPEVPVLGNFEDDSGSLRVGREEALRTTASSTIDAVYERVIQVPEVTSVRVFENSSYETTWDGMPPKSFEVMVQGGSPSSIAQAIWGTKPAGMRTHGNTSSFATSVQDTSEEVHFTRPEGRSIVVDLTGVVTGPDFPIDGEDRIKAAIVEHGRKYGIGEDVIRTRLFCPILKVLGVLDIGDLEIGIVGDPIGEWNVDIGPRQISTWHEDNISIGFAP